MIPLSLSSIHRFCSQNPVQSCFDISHWFVVHRLEALSCTVAIAVEIRVGFLGATTLVAVLDLFD